MFNRVNDAIAAPGAIPAFVRMHVIKLARLFRDHRFGEAIGYAVEIGPEWNPYYEMVCRRGNGRFVRREVQGSDMYLHSTGSGICRTLLAYGVHEQLSTDAFIRELRRLRTDVDGEVTMIDIGANVGYFSLLAARTLGEQARIYAIEPEPGNLALLERNVALNGDEDVIDIEQYAVGDRVETAELYLSGKPNRHMVLSADATRTPAEQNRLDDISAAESISIPQVTVEHFLTERSVRPESINVIRLDVEGHERYVFEGMYGVLAAPGPTLIHIELHPRYLSPGPIAALITTLEDAGFEIVSAVIDEATCSVPDGQDWHGNPLDLSTWEALREVLANTRFAIELVARKRGDDRTDDSLSLGECNPSA